MRVLAVAAALCLAATSAMADVSAGKGSIRVTGRETISSAWLAVLHHGNRTGAISAKVSLSIRTSQLCQRCPIVPAPLISVSVVLPESIRVAPIARGVANFGIRSPDVPIALI